MNEKVILPNFDLPRDSTRVAMRTLWAMGGVVVLATLVLGLVMWHHRSIELATAEQAVAKAAARRAALAAPPVAAPAAVVAGAQPAAVGGGATTLANVVSGAAAGSATGSSASASIEAEQVGASVGASARSRHTSKAGRARGMRGSALLEKIDGKNAKPAASSAKPEGRKSKSNDDVIDRLLNQYK